MTKIDWSGELEAYHEDGRVVPVKLKTDMDNPDCSGDYYTDQGFNNYEGIWYADGSSWLDCAPEWRIRNRQPTTNDRLTRLEAFVARVAEGGQMLALGHYEEAKALVAEIAPVDSDLIEARRIAVMVSKQTGKNAERFLSGAHDESFAVRCAVEALRQSRKEGPVS